MNEIISIILDYALEFIIAVVVILVTRVVIPWLKEKRIYGIVEKFVKAAEKLKESGQLPNGQTKLEYVTGLLEEQGYTVNDTVRAIIEAAVKELDFTKNLEASKS